MIPEGNIDHRKISHFLGTQEGGIVFQSVYDANGCALMLQAVNFTTEV